MIDLIAMLGFVVVLAGITDTFTNSTVKNKVAATVLNPSSQSLQNLWVNRVADRFLGSKLISFRAFGMTAIFTFASLIVAVVLAWFPNGSVLSDLLYALLANSPSGSAALLICFIGCLVADFFSVAQMRLFARTIEKFNDRSISLILCIADIFMSLMFFIVVFSAFRVAAYAIIIINLPSGGYSYKSTILPSVVSRAIDMAPAAKQKLFSFDRADEGAGSNSLLVAVYHTGKNQKLSKNLDDLFRNTELHASTDSKFMNYKFKWSCFPGSNKPISKNYDGYAAYATSHIIYMEGLVEAKVREKDFKTDSLQNFELAFEQAIMADPGPCPIKSLQIDRTIDARRMLGSTSLLDAYLAASSLTLRDAFSSISTKLAAYHSPDLGDETKDFLYGAFVARSQSLLGLWGEDSESLNFARAVYRSNSDEIPSASIPMTTFVASSLLASIILLISVSWSTFLQFVASSQRRLQRYVDRSQFSKIIFTAIASIASMVIITIYVFSLLAQWIWMGLLY